MFADKERQLLYRLVHDEATRNENATNDLSVELRSLCESILEKLRQDAKNTTNG